MGKRKPPTIIKTSVSGLIGDAVSDLQGLAEEMSNWRDGMEGTNLESTQKFETVNETTDALENAVCELENLEVPDNYDLEATFTMPKKLNARWRRCDCAVQMLETAKGVLESIEDENEGDCDTRQSVIDYLDGAISELGSVEFPGMYG